MLYMAALWLVVKQEFSFVNKYLPFELISSFTDYRRAELGEARDTQEFMEILIEWVT